MAAVMQTWKIRDEFSDYIEVTLCDRSVVVEDYRPGRPMIVRGGSIINGYRIHEQMHDSEEAAYEDAQQQIRAARVTVATTL